MTIKTWTKAERTAMFLPVNQKNIKTDRIRIVRFKLQSECFALQFCRREKQLCTVIRFKFPCGQSRKKR